MSSSADRQAARLKRRAERLGPQSRAHSSSVGGTSSTSSSRHSSAMSSRDASAAAFSSRARGSSLPTHSSSGESLRRPPPAPVASGHSSTSANAVAMSTRRGSNSARSPRDINVLVDKLLAKVHGAPSAITTRRTVVRLHDAVSVAPQTDSVRAAAAVFSPLLLLY